MPTPTNAGADGHIKVILIWLLPKFHIPLGSTGPVFPHDLIPHALAADSQAGNVQLIPQTSRSCCGSGKEMRVRYGREEERISMPGSEPLTHRLPPHPRKSGSQILGATRLPLCSSAPAVTLRLQEIPPCEGFCRCKAALHRAQQSLLCSCPGQDQRLLGGVRMPLWEAQVAASQPQLLMEPARPRPSPYSAPVAEV